MSLKNMFSAMKKEGFVTAPLDQYLFEQANKPNDRAVNVNAPSQAGKCNRANYYMRKQVEGDGGIDPRTQRIFDNGTGVHERLQKYLMDMFLLICDELPIIDDEYNIQGHTDGLLDLSDINEIAVLEIKSINDNQFTQLKDAKDEHKKQGLIYLYSVEKRRQYLRETYKTIDDFNNSEKERAKYFEGHYQHMKSGKRFTREEKIANEVRLNLIADDILWHTENPVRKVIFLYEDKNTQALKEFVVERNMTTEPILEEVLSDYETLNIACENEEVPEREGTSKSCGTCKWCSYQSQCWVV